MPRENAHCSGEGTVSAWIGLCGGLYEIERVRASTRRRNGMKTRVRANIRRNVCDQASKCPSIVLLQVRSTWFENGHEREVSA